MSRVGLVLVVFCASARAQPVPIDPDNIDPSQIPVEPPPPPPPYPRALVERPLLLPQGRAETTVSAAMAQLTSGDFKATYSMLAVAGRIAGGPIEPFGGIELMPLYTTNAPEGMDLDVSRLYRIYAGTRFRLGSDTFVALSASAALLDTDRKRFSPGLVIEHKLRPSASTAVLLAGGVGYSYQRFYDDDRGQHSAAALAVAELELQLSPTVAAAVSGSVTQAWVLVEETNRLANGRTYLWGAGLVFSLTEGIDLTPQFAVPSWDAWSLGASLAIH